MTGIRSTKEADRKYMKHKMRLMKEARRRGNEAVVHRHATDLMQYFNVDGKSERPIEDILEYLEAGLEEEMIDMEYDQRFKRLREGVSSRYE